jgi:hypothetical protein
MHLVLDMDGTKPSGQLQTELLQTALATAVQSESFVQVFPIPVQMKTG